MRTEALIPALSQDPRIERLPCTHAGTYADDCICERVRQHKCYIVATCDRDLRRRIRKVTPPALGYCSGDIRLHGKREADASGEHAMQVPGVPIMYLQSHRYTIERLPEATMGGAPRT